MRLETQILSQILAYQRDYSGLTLLDRQGQEVIRLSRSKVFFESELVNRSSMNEFIIPSTNRETYFSPVEIDQPTGEPLMTMALPLINLSTDTVDYVLVAEFRFKPIWDLLGASTLREGENVFVVDQQNRVVAEQNPSVVLKQTQFTIPQKDGPYTGSNGNEVILAFTSLNFGQQKFYVVAEQTRSVALKAAYDLRNTIAVALLSVITLTIMIGLFAVRQIVRPIQRLSDTAQAIEGGDLSRRIGMQKRRDEIGRLAKAFDSMTDQLRQTLAGLEERVAARTRDLQTAASVSKQITTVLEIDDLLQEVTTLTARSFELYACHIFRWHEETNLLSMAAGSASTGQMISKETIGDVSIDATPSLIARATRTRQIVVVNDVSQENDFLFLPALPLTQSELVLPIVLGDRLLGVFDIQSQQINRFGPDDIRVLQSLAEQVAIAIRNAELFAQAQSAREEAEQANKVKSQFLATMSHELRTPLNAILNFSQFISSGMVGSVNEEQRELTEKIASSGKHLLALINDVLDISKIEAGAFKLFVEENVNLRQEFDMVSDTARSLLGGKPIELVIEADESIPLIVGDKRRIRQIMLNLVSNACKFTEKGHVRLRLSQRDHEIVFAVEDSGPGIAAADQELIFETFRQGTSGLAQGGTGLGLPISRRLVAAHGGQLWVESTVGKGSEFYVSLPIHSEELTRMVIAL